MRRLAHIFIPDHAMDHGNILTRTVDRHISLPLAGFNDEVVLEQHQDCTQGRKKLKLSVSHEVHQVVEHASDEEHPADTAGARSTATAKRQVLGTETSQLCGKC